MLRRSIITSHFIWIALAALSLSAYAFGADTLTASKVAQAPKLSAGAADPTWAKAQPLSVPLNGGANFKDGSTTAVLKAVYSGDTLYMLVQVNDSTQSFRRSPFVKGADGKWTKLSDPDDKGGDKRHALVESVTTDRNTGEPDNSPNIVDRITGRLHQERQAPQQAEETSASASGKTKGKSKPDTKTAPPTDKENDPISGLGL